MKINLPRARKVSRVTIPSRELGVTLRVSQKALDEIQRLQDEQLAASKAEGPLYFR